MNQRRSPARRPLDGVLLFDKPVGLSSNTALQRVRRLFNAERAGHTGTLDPLASGLLPILFGEATKFGAELLDSDKAYRADIRFGIRTSTGDAEGEIVAQAPIGFSFAELERATASMLGAIEQIPPMYSALKREGKPLYEYARAGQELERLPRQVRINEMAVERFDGTFATVFVRCSKGTYIRTLAEDLAHRLDSEAHLNALRRTGVGIFSIEQALPLTALEAMDEEARDCALLDIGVLLTGLPEVSLQTTEAQRFCMGQALGGYSALRGRVRVYGAAAELLGIAEIGPDNALRPRRLLRSQKG
jgi:tRNA pseudouridine55 synthase